MLIWGTMRKGKTAGEGAGHSGFENPLDAGQKQARPATAPFQQTSGSRPVRQVERSEASSSYRPSQQVPPSFLMTAAARAKRNPPTFSEAASPPAALSSRQVRPATAAAPPAPDARPHEYGAARYDDPHTPSANFDPQPSIYTRHYGYDTRMFSDGSNDFAGTGKPGPGSARRADPWSSTTRHKPRGFNPDFMPSPATTAAVGGGPAQEPGQQGYSTRPVYGFNSRYNGAASWAFRPADYTWRSMTRAEKERAVAAAYAGGPRADSLWQQGDAEDPLLRFVTEARWAMDRVDLDHSVAPLVGYKVVAGAPDARLVGGQWRWVPKPAKQLPEGRVWTEHFGPVGGSGPITSHYGKKYDAEGTGSYLVH